jgi:hypothetical protein
MFTVEESWKMSEPELVLAMIKEMGIWRLGNCDGCMCSSFSLRNVHVDISCGKGTDRAVRVYSYSGDYDDNHNELLRPVAEEVRRQVEESDLRGPAPIFYAEWKPKSAHEGSFRYQAPEALPSLPEGIEEAINLRTASEIESDRLALKSARRTP